MAEAPWHVHRLEWDSEFWAAAWRASTPTCVVPTLGGLKRELEDLDLAYLLCDVEWAHHVAIAEDAGFRVVDLRCEVAADLAVVRPDGHDPRIRPARPEEIDVAAEMAATSHRNTRFGNDSRLPQDLVGELYRRWVHRDAQRVGWGVLVATTEAAVVGYATHGPTEDEGAATIGLIAVDQRRVGAVWRGAADGSERGRGVRRTAHAAHRHAGRQRGVVAPVSSSGVPRDEAGPVVALAPIMIPFNRPPRPPTLRSRLDEVIRSDHHSGDGPMSRMAVICSSSSILAAQPSC